MTLHRDHRAYLDRLRTRGTGAFDLTQIPKWIERNTCHPADPDKPWSFKDHEYQIEILSDMSDEVVAQKCSQVGASEMWVRMVLGMLVLARRITIIYVLPTATFSRNFAKQRFDAVVADSKELKSQMNAEVDSASLKQLGKNFLYITGSFGQSSAISVPAQGLFQDEVDFCNQTTLTTFQSRLGHAKPGEFYKRSFSTPTVEDFGINKQFKGSSQAHYTVRCRQCNDQVAPNFMDDVEIPGFDGTLNTFDKSDLENPNIRIADSFVRCPVCRTPLRYEDLCNPTMRQWIHKRPENPVRGYQILPIDVPAVNPVARTISQIKDYERKKDWVNFKVGYPFADAESSFLTDTIDRMSRGQALPRPEDNDLETVYTMRSAFGLDVGKTSWFVLYVHAEGEARVAYTERIRQDGDNYLGKRVLHLMRVFGCYRGVVDAGPDISVSKYIVEKSPMGYAWACYYVRQLKTELENYRLNEEEGIISANRTGTIDSLAKRMNSGKTVLARGLPDLGLIKEHLNSLKRVETRNDAGELLASWVSTGDDHYGHALNYGQIAYDMMISGAGLPDVTPSIPMMTKVKMRDVEPKRPQEADPLKMLRMLQGTR